MRHVSNLDGETLTTLDDIVIGVIAAVRNHPHVGNVLTHISGVSWIRIEQTLRVILDIRTTRQDLTPLARNIVELMCADRGVTGRIFKPYLYNVLMALSGTDMAATLIAHINRLAIADGTSGPVTTPNLAAAVGPEPAGVVANA